MELIVDSMIAHQCVEKLTSSSQCAELCHGQVLHYKNEDIAWECDELECHEKVRVL